MPAWRYSRTARLYGGAAEGARPPWRVGALSPRDRRDKRVAPIYPGSAVPWHLHRLQVFSALASPLSICLSFELSCERSNYRLESLLNKPLYTGEHTLAYIAFISVILVLIRRLGKNLPPSVRQGLLMILVVLPPLGVAFSLLEGSEDRRARISVSFLGYSIPWASMRPCSLSPDPLATTGIWIGGGGMLEGALTPDTVALPGYRSHLVELCTVESPKALSLQVRVASEGMEFESSLSKLSLNSSDGVHTQRVVLRSLIDEEQAHYSSDLCLTRPDGTTISKANLIASVQSAWEADRRNAPATWRRKIKNAFRRLPLDEGREVFCMNLAGKRPCQKPSLTDPRLAIDPRQATFVWLQKSGPMQDAEWQVLPEIGAEWSQCPNSPKKAKHPIQITPAEFSATTQFDDSTRSRLSGFSLQMVSRRTLGGVADQAVPIPVDSMSPSGFRLGPPREFRLAVSGDRLLILFDEPAAQIRYDDLFGKGGLGAPEGEFTLSFGAPEGGDLLAADLSAAADGYTPKPLVAKWRASIRISSRSSQAYTITAPGSSPESRVFGEITSVPTPFSAKAETTVVPLVLLRRMGTPTGILLVPALASLVLLIGILLLMKTSFASGVPWDLAVLGVILLDFRFLLSTRMWMDASSSTSDTLRWLLTGCYPILLAPLIFCLGSILSSWISRRNPSAAGISPLAGRRSLFRGDFSKLLIWFGFAVVGSLIWLLSGTALSISDLMHNAALTLQDFAGQVAVIIIAILIAVSGFELTRVLPGQKLSQVSGINRPPFLRRGRRLLSDLRLITVCVACGLLMVLSRLLLLSFGWQESLPLGVKLDVLYLPLTAGMIAGLCSATSYSREWTRLIGVSSIIFAVFGITGYFLSDLGLLWIGGMSFLLLLPFEFRRLRSFVATGLSILLFFVLFLSPKILPDSFLFFLQLESPSILSEANIIYPDPLQVRRDRDHYRMMDAVAPDEVRLIPSQLAREVTIERFRLRYQALKGAWREGLRSGEAYGSSWAGAGLLQARPVVGEKAFREAARSDYVYQIYVRAEYGTAGLLALLFIYFALLLVLLIEHLTNPSACSSLAIWALGIAVGSALFMLGGTHGIFPFSGKWTFFMAVGSRSDFCLSTALLILGAGGQYDAK